MSQIIVIGGGVAGLVATLHLAERGLRPLLLEADPAWIGGRLRDGPPVEIEHAGQRWSFRAEHGVHGIWSPYRNLKATLARHALLPALIPSQEEEWISMRGSRVRSAGIGSAISRSPIPAPFHYLFMFLRPRFLNMLTPRDLLALPRLTGDMFAALAVDPLAEQRSLAGMSLADFTRGWPPNLSSLFFGLARNALSAHPEDVPASGFIVFLRFYTLMRRDAWAFDFLPGTGGSCVAAPLAARAQALGATLRLGATAIRLQRDAERWQVVTTDPSGAEQTDTADQLIMALDAPAAARLLGASPPTAAAAAGLRFPQAVPTAIIRLWFTARPRPVAAAGIFTGDVVIDNFFWLDRLQPDYATWSAASGGSAIEMHIYGPPELVAQPDAVLLARAITDVYRAFPELHGTLLHSLLQRNPAAHTLFSVGEPDQHLRVRTPWPALYACGDWVADPNPAMYLERATTTGILAANAALEQAGLAPWPIAPHPEPEWLAGRMAAGLSWLRRRMRRENRP